MMLLTGIAGDTNEFDIPCTDPEAGATVYFRLADPVKKEVTVEEGVVHLILDPADTAGLATYHRTTTDWDIRAEYPSGDVLTLARGILALVPQVP